MRCISTDYTAQGHHLRKYPAGLHVIIIKLDMHPPDASQVKALRMIAGVAFFVLSRFPKTLEQDKQLLVGQSLPDDLRLAVQFRLAKKQIMAQLLHDLAGRIKVCTATHHSPLHCTSRACASGKWPACTSMAVQVPLPEVHFQDVNC